MVTAIDVDEIGDVRWCQPNDSRRQVGCRVAEGLSGEMSSLYAVLTRWLRSRTMSILGRDQGEVLQRVWHALWTTVLELLCLREFWCKSCAQTSIKATCARMIWYEIEVERDRHFEDDAGEQMHVTTYGWEPKPGPRVIDNVPRPHMTAAYDGPTAFASPQ